MSATRKPRFNHVAMSVPFDLIDGTPREELIDFYTTVFGWTHLPMMDVDRKRLVFQTYSLEQFVFIHGDEDPLRCPRLDHYGFSVGTEEELDDILAKARAYQERDSRVDIIDKHRDDHGPIAITAIYIGFVLPMMVEIQWWQKEWERQGATA
jgi:hypothetical protein